MSTLDFELKKFQQAHPGMSFVQSWRALKRDRPELFDDSRPASPRTSNSQGSTTAAAKRLRARAELIRAAEGISFAQAWTKLRSREPELFGVVTAARAEVVECVGGFATRLW